jgi:hypothetical protein
MEDEELDIIPISNSIATQTDCTGEQNANRSFDPTFLSVFTSLYLVLVSIATRLDMPGRFIRVVS